MFFERGAYDPASAAEGRVRLQQFQGATSISSNQYFGREEEEAAAEGSDGLLGDGSLAGLETAARDAVTRIMANPDVQNLGENLRSGALKVCAPFADVTRRDSQDSFWLFCLSALGLSGADVRTLVGWWEHGEESMGGTGRRFCFFSNETFVVCRPGLDDSFQLRAENLILLEPLLFFLSTFPYSNRGAALRRC